MNGLMSRRRFLNTTALTAAALMQSRHQSPADAFEVDFSSIDFFPLLKSKTGIARALADINVLNSLPYMDEIRPALYNGELRFPETDWPFLDPYPIEVATDGTIEVHDNQPLRDLHRGLRQRGIEIVHQLIGAPKQWHPYDEAVAPKKFPAPTDLEKSALAMKLFTEQYSGTPITWTLWNEPEHNLTGVREPESVQTLLDIYEAYFRAMAGQPRAVFGMANFIPWGTEQLDVLGGKSYVQAAMDEYLSRAHSNPDIELERFTVNNYGPRVWQLLDGCRNALGTRMNKLPLTLLQYGPFNPGREWDENAGTTLEAVKSIADFDKFLQISDLETVSFAGWLGHVLLWRDDEVLRLPLFNMLKLYSRMPIWRVKTDGALPSTVGAMASVDQYRAGVMLWNNSTESYTLDVNLTHLPERARTRSIYHLDRDHGSPLEGSTGRFGPTTVVNISADSVLEQVTIAGPGIVYIEVDSGKRNPILDRRGLREATFVRKHSYHQRFTDATGMTRVRSDYGAYDAVRGIAHTGVKGLAGSGICGAEYENLPDRLTVDILAHKVQRISEESMFGIRVDYVENGKSVRSVLWHGDIFDPGRTQALPWGKGGATADILIRSCLLDGEQLVLDLKKYSPGNWWPTGRRAIVSFWMDSTGEDSQASFLLGEAEEGR